MKKIYSKPVIKVLRIEEENVIAQSTFNSKVYNEVGDDGQLAKPHNSVWEIEERTEPVPYNNPFDD